MAFYSRGPNKVENPYTIIDSYEFYIDGMEETDLYYVTYNEYRDIVCAFYKNIIETVLRKNIVFKLPFNLGALKITKKKISLDHLSISGIDWPKTVEAGKYVYHLNEHSRGYKYFFHWEKKNRTVKNLFLYRLVLTRRNKRLLAKLIKSNKYDYFEI